MSLIVVLLASFTVYIYSFTTIVLGDIYTAFPGQDSVTVLIASLPAVVMMISAFASAFLLAKFNRKLLVIISMVIAVAAGLVVAYVEIPVAGIVACSALMGIPAGVVAAANASVFPVLHPIHSRIKSWASIRPHLCSDRLCLPLFADSLQEAATGQAALKRSM